MPDPVPPPPSEPDPLPSGALPAVPRWAAALGVLLLLLLHLVALDRTPRVEADEGGWPLAVREWVTDGTVSRDYAMAPGYHWLLGAFLRVFGPYHWVTRPVSAVVSLAGLGLFFLLARRLSGSARTGFWAAMLAGTSYGAVMVNRRAFMEPFQLLLMMALCLAALGSHRRPWREAAVAALAALLLLTKASAVFLLPALVLAAAGSWTALRWRPMLRLTLVLGAGVAVAAAGFAWIGRAYPAEFAEGWGSDMAVTNLHQASPWVKFGRFGIDPKAIEASIAWLGIYEPMFGLAVAAAVMALATGRQWLMALWFLFGAAFLSIQFFVQDNHRVVILPAVAFLIAWLLGEVETALGGRARVWRSTWPAALVLLMVGFNATRLVASLARVRQPEAPALAWVAARAKPEERVLAAPYLLMRLTSRPVSLFRLEKPYLPTAGAVRRLGADWIIVDDREWLASIDMYRGNRAYAERGLQECCTLAWQDPAGGFRVFRAR